MKNSDKKILLEFLSKNKLMCLATYYKEPWSAIVYYLFDGDLNIYFLSPTDTTHCKNIEKNPKVSLVIADSRQRVSDKKIGLQMRGVAKRLLKPIDIKGSIKVWNQRHPDLPLLTYKVLMEVWKSRFYKMTPSYIKFFNEVLYGEEGTRDWKL